MISDELLSKFDRIQDLPVSEEMLGAYLEGNLSSSEIGEIETTLYENPYLNDLIDDNYLNIEDSNDDLALQLEIDEMSLPIVATEDLIEFDYNNQLPDSYFDDMPMVAACATDDMDFSFDNESHDDSMINPFEGDDTTIDLSDDNNITNTDYE